MRSVVETELAWRGRNPREAGGLAKPLAWCPLEERSLTKEKTLGEARQAWGASPGLESLVLSKISLKSYVGPGRPARGTLVSTVPTVAPGPTMGTPESEDGGEASRAQRRLPGP